MAFIISLSLRTCVLTSWSIWSYISLFLEGSLLVSTIVVLNKILLFGTLIKCSLNTFVFIRCYTFTFRVNTLLLTNFVFPKPSWIAMILVLLFFLGYCYSVVCHSAVLILPHTILRSCLFIKSIPLVFIHLFRFRYFIQFFILVYYSINLYFLWSNVVLSHPFDIRFYPIISFFVKFIVTVTPLSFQNKLIISTLTCIF